MKYLEVIYFQLDQQKNMCVRACMCKYVCVSTYAWIKQMRQMLQLLNPSAQHTGFQCIIL